MDLNKEISKLLGPDLVKQIKDLKQKFSLPTQAAAPTIPAAPANPVQPPAQDQVQLQEATLTDGTVIKYNTPTLAAGSEVTIVSPEGEMPAPEGELTLQDGTVIKVVNQDGKSVVESVTPGSGEANPAPVLQEAADNLNSKILEIANLLKGFQEELKAEKEEKEALKKENAEIKEKFSALEGNVGQFIQLFTSVIETPSAAPIENPKNKFTAGKKNSIVNKLINP